MYSEKIKQATKRKRKGFTLIEMVISITIIGILSSIAVGKYGQVQKNARLNADYATASNLATAATLAMSDNNKDTSVSNLEKEGYITHEPVSKSEAGSAFVITVDSNENITITANSKPFYPKPATKSEN